MILPPLSQEMAHYHSPTTFPTTFCEVTYDTDWLDFEDDRHLTPYRYSLLRNDTDTNSDTVSLTLPSHAYYEYLRTYYDCRTTPNRVPSGYAAPSGSHVSQQGRSVTWHAFSKENGSELSRQGVRSEPLKIRPTYPFPSLHLIQGGDSGDELDAEHVYSGRTKEKLVWVDALNKWVPQKQFHPRPYMSFIGNVPVVEKQGKFPKEIAGGGSDSEAAQTCDRFELHMSTSVSQPQYKSVYKQRNNEKREAIRKRAQEMADQRKHRKAYSTPLYMSVNERKQNMKPRVQSSGTPYSLPVSPIQQKVPLPKQVWLAEEMPKLGTVPETGQSKPVAVKKEISITLMSPQPDADEEIDEGDEKDKLSEKKVTFTDDSPTTANPKKDQQFHAQSSILWERMTEDEDFESSHDAEKKEEMKQQEKQLIESLEKQRELQMLEQQKLLAEEQRKEKERKEKERLAGEERLRKMKESHNMHKQPLSTQTQNHDNYYENTMNAAGKGRKGKGKPQTKQTKIEKTSRKAKKKEEERESGNVVNSVKYVKPAKPLTDNKIKARDTLAKKLKPAEQTPKVVPKSKPEPKSEVPSKPMLAGMGAQQKVMAGLSHATKPEKKEEKLPVTKSSEVVNQIIEEEGVVKPKSPASERRKNVLEQREIAKKERRDARKCMKQEEEKKILPEPGVEKKKTESWIYGDDDDEDYTVKAVVEEEKVESAAPLPFLLADLKPELIEKEKKESKEIRRKSMLSDLMSTDKAAKKWRKPGILDNSYADELRKLELAEERRKKQMEMYERLKNRKITKYGNEIDDCPPRFEDYGFLAKYCIFTKGNIEMYRHAFNAVDDGRGGWLEGEDVMIALRGVNNKLTEAEEEYLYRVLELTGYKLYHGADFKIFSVLAALSQRISALDKWMKNLIGQMDFKALEMKMFKCRALWECNVDKDTNSITIDQLCVDLRAGGVSFEHEMEVREKLAHLHALDLLDFLTYIPLFIMIHESVVKNPLDDTRNK